MEKGGSEHDLAASVATVPLNKTPSFLRRDAENNEERFRKALRELKELRSQLRQAADYCETAFLKTQQKKLVLENTKSYLCEAIVAVVDHLGNVSSKLEQALHDTDQMVNTEQRMDCLKQRLLTCQQYAISLELSSMKWSVNLPKHHQHYVSQFNQLEGKLKEFSRSTEASDSEALSETPETKYEDYVAMRVHDSIKTHKASTVNAGSVLAKAVPVLDKPSFQSRPPDHSYYSKSEQDNYLKGSSHHKKPLQVNFLSLLGFSRRKK